jgi:hypothetical protein
LLDTSASFRLASDLVSNFYGVLAVSGFQLSMGGLHSTASLTVANLKLCTGDSKEKKLIQLHVFGSHFWNNHFSDLSLRREFFYGVI